MGGRQLPLLLHTQARHLQRRRAAEQEGGGGAGGGGGELGGGPVTEAYYGDLAPIEEALLDEIDDVVMRHVHRAAASSRRPVPPSLTRPGSGRAGCPRLEAPCRLRGGPPASRAEQRPGGPRGAAPGLSLVEASP